MTAPIKPCKSAAVHSREMRKTLAFSGFRSFGNHNVNEMLKSLESPVFIEFADDYTHREKAWVVRSQAQEAARSAIHPCRA